MNNTLKVGILIALAMFADHGFAMEPQEAVERSESMEPQEKKLIGAEGSDKVSGGLIIEENYKIVGSFAVNKLGKGELVPVKAVSGQEEETKEVQKKNKKNKKNKKKNTTKSTKEQKGKGRKEPGSSDEISLEEGLAIMDKHYKAGNPVIENVIFFNNYSHLESFEDVAEYIKGDLDKILDHETSSNKESSNKEKGRKVTLFEKNTEMSASQVVQPQSDYSDTLKDLRLMVNKKIQDKNNATQSSNKKLGEKEPFIPLTHTELDSFINDAVNCPWDLFENGMDRVIKMREDVNSRPDNAEILYGLWKLDVPFDKGDLNYKWNKIITKKNWPHGMYGKNSVFFKKVVNNPDFERFLENPTFLRLLDKIAEAKIKLAKLRTDKEKHQNLTYGIKITEDITNLFRYNASPELKLDFEYLLYFCKFPFDPNNNYNKKPLSYAKFTSSAPALVPQKMVSNKPTGEDPQQQMQSFCTSSKSNPGLEQVTNLKTTSTENGIQVTPVGTNTGMSESQVVQSKSDHLDNIMTWPDRRALRQNLKDQGYNSKKDGCYIF